MTASFDATTTSYDDDDALQYNDIVRMTTASFDDVDTTTTSFDDERRQCITV